MKYINFTMKLICLLLIFAALFYYQTSAKERATLEAANREEIAKVNAENAKIVAQQAKEEESGYKNGTYEGQGTGFGGPITVSLTIKDGIISQIEATSYPNEDLAYFTLAKRVLDDMVIYQNTQVDIVSGATFSSNGLIEAATNALRKAEK